jgi:hypothetical protein
LGERSKESKATPPFFLFIKNQREVQTHVIALEGQAKTHGVWLVSGLQQAQV